MIHKARAFHIVEMPSAEELAKKLTDFTWTLCTGFKHGGRLFLNDAFTEDGAQEYAIVKDGVQIEGITFSWCTYEKALAYIHKIDAGEFDHEHYDRFEVREASEAPCALCR